jgi:hypothetical protein
VLFALGAAALASALAIEDVGEAVGGGLLPQREGGRAQGPGFSLVIGVVDHSIRHPL